MTARARVPNVRRYMTGTRGGDERDELIARLEHENAQLVDRLARLRPALHGLTEDLVRAHRDTAEWRRRYRELADRGEPARRGELRGLPSRSAA